MTEYYVTLQVNCHAGHGWVNLRNFDDRGVAEKILEQKQKESPWASFRLM